MCGLAGCLAWTALQDDALLENAQRMAAALSHRGPDDAGAWQDSRRTIALSHRRLAVVELSSAGHQPMLSASGRFAIVFNGEVYNHLGLRGMLQAEGVDHAWRGGSDTETLLVATERWGLEQTLQRCVGMFALAMWDQRERVLHLARDRFGEKPLYYGWLRGGFAFASELKALRAHRAFAAGIDRAALAQYFRFGYFPAPHTVYEDVYKLEPGCILTLSCGQGAVVPARGPLRAPARHGPLRIERYWQLRDALARRDDAPITTEADAIGQLESRLRDAVSLQMLADVPLGAFLSGGIDSSTIVALMQSVSTRPVKTFTVGFEEGGFDESPFAKAVACHLGTEHHELVVTAAEARGVIARLPAMYDEPFADSSQIPTHLVCRAARSRVTVALSGDAGDELFGGYNRYVVGPRLWRSVSWMPFAMRRALAAGLHAVPQGAYESAGSVYHGLRGRTGPAQLGSKVHKFAHRMRTVQDTDDLYRSLVTEWQDPEELVRDAPSLARLAGTAIDDPLQEASLRAPAERMMWRDTHSYLPDDILCKVDRAAMATSLETRAPFLDHRVAELAWRMPLHMKIRGGEGKWVLRQVLYRHVPRELIERPKAGFAIPIGNWLRGPLREWAEALLEPRRLEREGFLHPGPVVQVWRDHLAGRQDHTPKLWSVLMFQAWLEAQAQE